MRYWRFTEYTTQRTAQMIFFLSVPNESYTMLRQLNYEFTNFCYILVLSPVYYYFRHKIPIDYTDFNTSGNSLFNYGHCFTHYQVIEKYERHAWCGHQHLAQGLHMYEIREHSFHMAPKKKVPVNIRTSKGAKICENSAKLKTLQ